MTNCKINSVWPYDLKCVWPILFDNNDLSLLHSVWHSFPEGRCEMRHSALSSGVKNIIRRFSPPQNHAAFWFFQAIGFSRSAQSSELLYFLQPSWCTRSPLCLSLSLSWQEEFMNVRGLAKRRSITLNCTITDENKISTLSHTFSDVAYFRIISLW